MVRPKKYLGQHFLKDRNIAARIVDSLRLPTDRRSSVLEIGPGTGVLTGFLLQRKEADLTVIEIDRESVDHLAGAWPDLKDRIIEGDFINMDWASRFRPPLHIIGNFPYNISSQIFFSILDHRELVEQVVCMIQKEVADRICSRHGNKTYGILSVLLQAYFSVEFLFKVPAGVFQPPPRVTSAVIRLTRLEGKTLDCDEPLFHFIVKQAFQKRRKTLRNALKHLNLPGFILTHPWMDKRPEQLSVEDFIFLTRSVQSDENIRRI